MSADVQPRKRKDKKKKRDSLDSKSEEEIITRKLNIKDDEEIKESHHGVHVTKMGADDVHLHIQGDHSTGGHWCAKLFFFSLLAILLGLIGLIIIENRGLSDLDTPLSESRYSEYFEGWVDEHRGAHDDHGEDKIPPELENHDAEPFEEEEDHSEIEEDDDHDDVQEHVEDDIAEKNVENDDDDDDVEETSEDIADEEITNDESEGNNPNDEEDEIDDDEDADAEEIDIYASDGNTFSRTKRELKNDDDEEDVDEGFDEADDDNDDKEQEELEQPLSQSPQSSPPTNEQYPYEEHELKSEKTRTDFGIKNEQSSYESVQHIHEKCSSKKDNKKCVNNKRNENKLNTNSNAQPLPVLSNREKRNPYEDDDDFESLEHVVDNDADEQLHLQQRARQDQELSPSMDEQEQEEESSSPAKHGSGGTDGESEITMRRRLTMVTAEEPILSDFDEQPDDLEEDYMNEEIDEEEEEGEEEYDNDGGVEYSEEEEEEEKQIVIEKYVPETFEQMNAMYRPKEIDYSNSVEVEDIKPEIQEHKKTIDEIKQKIDDLPSKSEEFQQKVEKVITLPNQPYAPQEVSKQILKTESPIGKPEDKHNYNVEELSEGEEEEEEEAVDEEELRSEEEDISDDVDDDEDDDLMKRLEEKYGKLPQRQYDSEEDGDDVEDNSWTKIKSRPGGGPQAYNEDDFIEEELRRANEEMLQNNLQSGLKIFEILSLKYPDVPGALYGKAKALDRLSEELQSNQILIEAIMAYKRFLALEENIDDDLFKEAAERCIDRMRFRGLNLQAVRIHEMLIKRFENESYYRNQLAVSYLLINRLTDAKKVLKETLVRWPENGFAQVHYGFVLKNLDKNLEKAAEFMSKGIKSQENGTQDGRFYFNLGDALQRLGRSEEAMQVYREAAEKKLFLSEYQRSLYNVDNLRAQPFWSKEQTTYGKYFDELERNWQQIKEEGLNVLNEKGFFMDEAESLRDFGDWKQFELFARGHRNRKNCAKAPITCALLESFPAARFCKRGQTKFSVMHPRTHVWPHCGPTNCRIRAHLGLKIPSGTKIRVAKENRNWKEGKFLIFDDSFEHEVWHNGTSLRLVLIVDVWHPELTEEQRNNLSPI